MLGAGVSSSIHLMADREYKTRIALHCISWSWGQSYSNFLKAGLAEWLTKDRETIHQSACALQQSGDWLSWLRLLVQPPTSEIVSSEMALYISCLVDHYEVETIQSLWYLTTVWGGSHSLRGALDLLDTVDFNELEDEVQRALSLCSSS